jgi:hypothetical protein
MLPKLPKRELPGTFPQQSKEPVDWRVSETAYLAKHHGKRIGYSFAAGLLLGAVELKYFPALLDIAVFRLSGVPIFISLGIMLFIIRIVPPQEDIRGCRTIKCMLRLMSIGLSFISDVCYGYVMGTIPAVFIHSFVDY